MATTRKMTTTRRESQEQYVSTKKALKLMDEMPVRFSTLQIQECLRAIMDKIEDIEDRIADLLAMH